jgi:hypothetical protein
MKNPTPARVYIREKYREMTVHMDDLKTFEPVIQMFLKTSVSVELFSWDLLKVP